MSSPGSERVLIRARSSHWLVLQSALNHICPPPCVITVWWGIGTINLIQYWEEKEKKCLSGSWQGTGEEFIFTRPGSHFARWRTLWLDSCKSSAKKDFSNPGLNWSLRIHYHVKLCCMCFTTAVKNIWMCISIIRCNLRRSSYKDVRIQTKRFSLLHQLELANGELTKIQ